MLQLICKWIILMTLPRLFSDPRHIIFVKNNQLFLFQDHVGFHMPNLLNHIKQPLLTHSLLWSFNALPIALIARKQRKNMRRLSIILMNCAKIAGFRILRLKKLIWEICCSATKKEKLDGWKAYKTSGHYTVKEYSFCYSSQISIVRVNKIFGRHFQKVFSKLGF